MDNALHLHLRIVLPDPAFVKSRLPLFPARTLFSTRNQPDAAKLSSCTTAVLVLHHRHIERRVLVEEAGRHPIERGVDARLDRKILRAR